MSDTQWHGQSCAPCKVQAKKPSVAHVVHDKKADGDGRLMSTIDCLVLAHFRIFMLFMTILPKVDWSFASMSKSIGQICAAFDIVIDVTRSNELHKGHLYLASCMHKEGDGKLAHVWGSSTIGVSDACHVASIHLLLKVGEFCINGSPCELGKKILNKFPDFGTHLVASQLKHRWVAKKNLDCPNPSTAGLQTRYGPVFNEMHLRDVKFAKAFPVATLLKLGKALPIIKAELASAMPVGRRDRASKVWVVAAFAGDGLVAKGLGRTFASALSASFTHLAFHLMRKHVEGDIGKKIKLFEPAVHAFANDHVLSVCTTIFGTMCKNPPIAKQPGTTARTEPPAARTQAKAASREAKKRGSRNVECRQSPSSSHDAGQATERDRDQLAVSRRDSGAELGLASGEGKERTRASSRLPRDRVGGKNG